MKNQKCSQRRKKERQREVLNLSNRLTQMVWWRKFEDKRWSSSQKKKNNQIQQHLKKLKVSRYMEYEKVVLIKISGKKRNDVSDYRPILLLNILSGMMIKYNSILRSGMFPDAWKLGKVVIIDTEKKEKRRIRIQTDPLAEYTCKLMEKMMKLRIETDIENRSWIFVNQYGFQKGKSKADVASCVCEIANGERRVATQYWKLAVASAL